MNLGAYYCSKKQMERCLGRGLRRIRKICAAYGLISLENQVSLIAIVVQSGMGPVEIKTFGRTGKNDSVRMKAFRVVGGECAYFSFRFRFLLLPLLHLFPLSTAAASLPSPSSRGLTTTLLRPLTLGLVHSFGRSVAVSSLQRTSLGPLPFLKPRCRLLCSVPDIR